MYLIEKPAVECIGSRPQVAAGSWVCVAVLIGWFPLL